MTHMPSKKAAKKPKNGVHTTKTGSSSRKYERTTPVGRVVKHLGKSLRVASFSVDRMSTWEHANEPRLTAALIKARSAIGNLTGAVEDMQKLFDDGWKPPQRPAYTVYAEGDEVKIIDRQQDKYLQLYSHTVVDNLVVAKVLPSGEVAVRHGKEAPFLVPKSHIEKRASSSPTAKSSENSHQHR
jgi:hypothetical protein